MVQLQPGLRGAWHSLYRHQKEVFSLSRQGKGNMIRGEKKTLTGMNLPAVLSLADAGGQLSLGQVQDGLLLPCCRLVCSHPAPVTSDYLVTSLKRSLSSIRNTDARGVLKLGMQHQAPVLPVSTLTASPATHRSVCEMLPLLNHLHLNSVHFHYAALVFW